MESTFDILGMSCSACSARVQRTVTKIRGVKSVSVNLAANTMLVTGKFSESEVIAAVIKAGYRAEKRGAYEGKPAVSEARELKTKLTVMIISVSLVAVLMFFSMAHMFVHLSKAVTVAFGIISAVLAFAVMIVNYRYFIGGVKGAVRLAPNMDTLVSLGSFVSFAFGLYSLVLMGVSDETSGAYLNGMNGLFFDSAAMILAFVDIGKFLEALGKKKTVSAIDTLAKLRPLYTNVEVDGLEKSVATAMLKVDDIIIVRAGEHLPCDGIIVSGNGSLDEAAITGESLPRDVREGLAVTGASILLTGFIKFRAVKVGADTLLSQVIKLVESAAASKAPIAKTADKVSGIFVPIVLALAVIVFTVWAIIGQMYEAFRFAASVLVISCPCALGLATPLAVTVSLGQAAKRGILIKNAGALEIASRLHTVIFDKTGTVTEGNPEVTNVTGDLEFLPLVKAVESQSSHPLSLAIVNYVNDMAASGGQLTKGADAPTAANFEQFFGGVSGVVDGKLVIIGNEKLMAERGIPLGELYSAGAGELYAAVDEKAKLRITLADKIKPEARGVIQALKRLGIRTVLLTGDSEKNAAAVMAECGFDEGHYSLKPNDKERIISEMDNVTAMVGDGINDAPALSRASIGIAIGAGTDIAADAADIVLVGSNLSGVTEVIGLSKRTMRKIKQNLFWAFFYNVLCIPLAAGAFAALSIIITPMIAALAMSVSSLFVVGNSLLLGRVIIHRRIRAT